MMISYHKTSELETFVQKLGNAPTDWVAVRNRMADNDGSSFPGNDLPGYVAEVIAQVKLEELCRGCTTKEYRPQPRMVQPTSVTVELGNKNLLMHYGNNKEYLLEVDDWLRIEDVLAIIEVKALGPKAYRRFLNALDNPERDSLMQFMVEHFFREDGTFSYVVMTYGAMIDPNDPKQIEFQKRGGLLVPFYSNREQFYKDMLSIPNTPSQNT